MRTSTRGPLLPVLVFGIGALALGCSSEPLEPAPGSEAVQAPDDSAGPNDGSSAGADFENLEYPVGPYGRSIGAVIDNLQFLGWHEPLKADYDQANFETVRLSDFYDPDGTHGDLKIIVMNASAVWCTVCRAEYAALHDQDVYRTYRAKGVEIIGALFEDQDSGPAKPEDLEDWGAYGKFQVEFPLVLDPGFKLGPYFTSDATPLNLIIDARTMQIIDLTMGYDSTSDSFWQLIDAYLEARE